MGLREHTYTNKALHEIAPSMDSSLSLLISARDAYVGREIDHIEFAEIAEISVSHLNKIIEACLMTGATGASNEN